MRAFHRHAMTAATVALAATSVAATSAADRPEVQLRPVERGVGLGGSGWVDSASIIDGLLWTATDRGAVAWDVSNPLSPEPVGRHTHDGGIGMWGAEEVNGAAGTAIFSVWTETADVPAVHPGFQTRLLSDCGPGQCELFVVDTTPIPGQDRTRVVKRLPFEGHNVTCLSGCTVAWATNGDTWILDGAETRQAGASWMQRLDVPRPHHIREVAQDRTIVAGWGAAAVVDTTDPLAPRMIRMLDGIQPSSGNSLNHVDGVWGTTEAFVGEYGTNVTTAGPRCGVTWFDWESGKANSWVPEVLHLSSSSYPNTCSMKAAPHPDFAENRIVALAHGRAGLLLAEVSEKGGFTKLAHLPIELGMALDVTWTSDATLALATHEGGLVPIEVVL